MEIIKNTSGLKYFTTDDIKSWTVIVLDDMEFVCTAIDILNNNSLTFIQKLNIVLREEICSNKLMRLFAVYCARDTLNWITNPDPRSIEAVNVAERYANGGLATEEELAKAMSAAESAARSARSAVWSARSAAWSAAESAVWSARSAAWSAAESAVWSARSAAMSAAMSAGSAAESAAQKRYTDKLIEMILIEGKERRRR